MKQFIKDLKQTEFGIEGSMYCPIFDTEIEVIIENEKDIGYAEKCAEYLYHLPQDVFSRLCTYIIRYCESYREIFDDYKDFIGNIPRNIQGKEILQYMTINMLIVEAPKDLSIIGFHVSGNCQWEQEHGLEFSIRDGKILYVGSFNDISAWENQHEYYDPNEGMSCLNYADKEI